MRLRVNVATEAIVSGSSKDEKMTKETGG